MKHLALPGLFLLTLNLTCARPTNAPPNQTPEFTSSDVADAGEQLTGHRVHLSDQIRLLAGDRAEGPAVTLRLIRDEGASVVTAGVAAIQLLETAPQGAVVVAVLEGETDYAVFGAAFATLAKERSLAAFVVDGSVRDLQELRSLGFPTFARGTVPGSAGGHYRVEATNVPVLAGGIEIAPGDYVVGDEDGVVVIPGERRREVLASARAEQREEQELLRSIERLGSYLAAIRERAATSGTEQ